MGKDAKEFVSAPAHRYHIISVSAGPTGLACGLEVARNNGDCLIIRNGHLTNSISYFPAELSFLSSHERLAIGRVPFVIPGENPSYQECLNHRPYLAEALNLYLRLIERVEGAVRKDDGIFVGNRRKRANRIVVSRCRQKRSGRSALAEKECRHNQKPMVASVVKRQW